MISSTNAQGTTTYSYNALGERVKKSGLGGTVLFAYDEEGHLIGEYTGAGGMIQEIVWFEGLPVASIRPAAAGGIEIFNISSDHLGTPRVIRRATDGVIVWRWDSDPFGVASPNENPSSTGTFKFNLRFPGQYADTETGLYYNYFRDYNPKLGRYMQSDPIGLRGGLNTYAYVAASPLLFADPRGLAPWEVIDNFEVGLVAGIGAQYVVYKLQSPCNNRGQRFLITVQAAGTSAGAALKCKVCFTSPHKLGLGGTFEDGNGLYPNPEAFNGPYLNIAAGGQLLSFGGNYGETVLGRARSGRGWTTLFGFGNFGAEVAATIGTATVTKTELVDCACKGDPTK